MDDTYSPTLGEHTEEFLRELFELPEAAIAAMRDLGAFCTDAPTQTACNRLRD
jgi:hypothetical protein